MLTYLLADVVAIASIGLFVAGAFLLPSIKRERDEIWSGVGLFYALVLFACAGQVRGGLLLGQIAGVALMGWLGWQAFGTRWATVPVDERQKVQSLTNLTEKVKGINFGNLGDQAKGLVGKVKDSAGGLDLGKLGDQAKGMAGKVKDAAKDVDLGKLGDQAKGMAGKVKDAAQNTDLQQKAAEVKPAVTKVAETAAAETANVKEAVVDASETVAQKAADVADDVKKG
jgi:methyl-accepting chemotaxis protein